MYYWGVNSKMENQPTKTKKLNPANYSMIINHLIEPKHYASVVGACIYMAITCRPDIAHAVGRVSRAMHNQITMVVCTT